MLNRNASFPFLRFPPDPLISARGFGVTKRQWDFSLSYFFRLPSFRYITRRFHALAAHSSLRSCVSPPRSGPLPIEVVTNPALSRLRCGQDWLLGLLCFRMARSSLCMRAKDVSHDFLSPPRSCNTRFTLFRYGPSSPSFFSKTSFAHPSVTP